MEPRYQHNADAQGTVNIYDMRLSKFALSRGLQSFASIDCTQWPARVGVPPLRRRST